MPTYHETVHWSCWAGLLFVGILLMAIAFWPLRAAIAEPTPEAVWIWDLVWLPTSCVSS